MGTVEVDYFFPDSDDQATREGKFEAIMDVVCAGENLSDVVPSGSPRRVTVVYAESERSLLEPVVKSIVENADGTFWTIAEKVTMGVSQSEIRSRLEGLGLTVGVMNLTKTGADALITTAIQATAAQWRTILARLEMGEGSTAAQALDACDEDD